MNNEGLKKLGGFQVNRGRQGSVNGASNPIFGWVSCLLCSSVASRIEKPRCRLLAPFICSSSLLLNFSREC